MADGFTFEFEGFDKVVRVIKELGDDRIKRSELLKIFRRQIEPAKRIMIAQAPVERTGRTITYHRNNSIKYKPGNLKRAITKFTGKSKDYPTISVGAKAKKPEGSGYYSWFIQHGTSGGIRNKNNYVQRANDLTNEIIGDKASSEVLRYIEKQAKRLGFSTV